MDPEAIASRVKPRGYKGMREPWGLEYEALRELTQNFDLTFSEISLRQELEAEPLKSLSV
jgi:hypothetical protein